MALVALGIFANQTQKEGEHPFQLSWTTTTGQLSFPKFQLSAVTNSFFGASAPSISSISCLHNNKTVKAGDNCSGASNNNTCVLINGNDVVASPSDKNPDAQRIDCTVNVNITGMNLTAQQINNLFLVWNLDNPNVENFGSNSYAPMYLSPNSKMWVLITPVEYDGNLAWERQQQFHGSEQASNTNVAFYVTTIINSFTYWSFKQRDPSVHDGWNTAASTGGYAFFLYLIHTIFMFFVGFALANDSIVLGGSKHDSGLNEDDALIKHQHNDL